MVRRFVWPTVLALVLFGFGCDPPVTDNDAENGGGGGDVAGDVLDDTTDDDEPDAADAVDEDGTDGEPDAAPDGDEGGDDAGDVGLDATADGGETDTRDCSLDRDSDGLTDCEEERLCTDLDNGDTDGDGLSDLEELQKQTDPCDSDTDGDGATDKEELEFDLDPKKQDTFGDGTIDGNRWILSACDDPQAEPVNFYESRTGNWKIALPPAYGNYTDLTLTNTSKPEAAAVYDDPANEVAGFLLSENAKSSFSGPVDALTDATNDIKAVGTIKQDFAGGGFDTHDGKRAATGEYRVKVGSGTSARKFRDDLLLQMAPFSRSDASGLPNSAGTPHTTYQVFVSAIIRKNSQGKDQVLLSVALAPRSKFTSVDRVQFRMDDLTNTTNVSEQVDGHLVKCATFQPGKGVPRAEFYWVLDQSGSMNTENQKVANFAKKFEKQVRNTALVYRLGVTNMDDKNKGRLRVPPAWHKQGATFKNEVQCSVINCGTCSGGNLQCSGGAEYGLQVAKQGITYMSGNAPQQPTAAERIRTQANVITIFMSDEEANSIKIDGKSVGPYKQWFKNRTTAFAIVGDGSSCGTDDGKAYRQVAKATGGGSASLCASSLKKTIRQILTAATGIASNYKLPHTPISGSLRVYLNGTWVPRSRQDGFDYFAENNAVAFYGKFRPSTKNKKTNDYVAVSYETFIDRCKENDQGPDNCSSQNP